MATLLSRVRNALISAPSSPPAASAATSAVKNATSSTLDTILSYANISSWMLNTPPELTSEDSSATSLPPITLYRAPITAGVNPYQVVAATTAQINNQTTSSGSNTRFRTVSPPSALGGPGLLGFLTSKWFFVLVITTALINRIQHICRPRNRPQPITGWKRIALKLPALTLLLRSVVFLLAISITLALDPPASVVTDTTSSGHQKHILVSLATKHILQPGWKARAWLGYLFLNPETGTFRIEAVSSQAIWAAFLASAAYLITETLIKSLEGGQRSSNPANGALNHNPGLTAAAAIVFSSPSTSSDRTSPGDIPSFNLAGFAFIAHACVFQPDREVNNPGPPTWCLFFSIFLQIAELSTIALASLDKSRPRTNLPITSFFGIVNTAHHLHWTYIGNPTDPFHLSNRFPDALLLLIIGLTACLHAITMIVTEGKIDPSRLLFNPSNLPGMTEDYNVAIIKIGTACLESTRLSGMSKELATIHTPAATWVEMDAMGGACVVSQGSAASTTSGAVRTREAVQHDQVQSSFWGLRRRDASGALKEIGRPGVESGDSSSEGEYGEDERDTISRHGHRSSRRQRADGTSAAPDERFLHQLRSGFALEIRDLRTAADGTLFGRNGHAVPTSSSLSILSGTTRSRSAEVRRFLSTLFRVLLSLVLLSLAWSWSWVPSLLRVKVEDVLLGDTERRRRRRRRKWRRWMRGCQQALSQRWPRYLRLLWHGQNGEQRREQALAAKRREEERRLAERAARVVVGSSSANNTTTGQEGNARTSRDNAHEGLTKEVELRRAFRAMSPSEAAEDGRFWRAMLTADGPEWIDDDDDDSEWREDDEDSDDAEEEVDDENAEGATLSAADQLAARSAQLQRGTHDIRRRRAWRSPSVGLTDDDFDAEEEEQQEGVLSLALAAQQQRGMYTDSAQIASGSGENEDLSQYLLMHMSNVGGSPLTRNRFRSLVGRQASGPITSAIGGMRDGSSSVSSRAGPFTGSSASSSGLRAHGGGVSEERDVLVDVIRMRREAALTRGAGAYQDPTASLLSIPSGTSGAVDEEEQKAEWERERQRLCVICQTENR
ncbi:hypothetical protein OC846_000818 [Tilletia horrida]|uniref:Uncharacterized protein n=1 Tax=Tilletia horrida TaxID=155126 RepID=A0AAN6K0K4_9BASI|nr:hypothetical protein OC845_002340 [Tilletia horrida]KAK0556974.1 hypothetical protein OC846_000818 [Tilletia horrida]KAK0566668.1 hypothetical protein OC861_003108 [Tilletia horrida]